MPNEPLRESCYEREGAGKLHRFSCFDAICFSFTPIFMTHQWVYSRFNHFIFYLMPCLETNPIYPNLIDSLGKKGFVPIHCRPVGAGGAGDARAPPDFDRSVDPNSTRAGGGAQFRPTILLLPPRIFRPSYGPANLTYIQIQCCFQQSSNIY